MEAQHVSTLVAAILGDLKVKEDAHQAQKSRARLLSKPNQPTPPMVTSTAKAPTPGLPPRVIDESDSEGGEL